METRVLGRTGVTVSRLGFGGAAIGLPRYLTPEDRDDPAVRAAALAAVRRAVEAGVTYFDVAPGYGDGRAERVYGEALEPHRGKVFLATKFWPGEPWTPRSATEQLQASLERLKTKSVDLLQYHGLGIDDAAEAAIHRLGMLEWMREQQAAGRCRWLGISAEGPSGALERLLKTGTFDVGLFAYNLIYQSMCDYQREPAGILPLAKSLGMGVATMRPATSGFIQKLLQAEFPDLPADRITRMAIRFVLSTPEVDVAVVGMRTPAEVDTNAGLARDVSNRYDLKDLHHRYV